MTHEEEMIRANEVKHLLQNTYLKAALEEIEQALVEQIVACPLEKPALLAELANILRCKRKFMEILSSHVETGKMAKIQIQEEERKGFMANLMKGKLWT